MKSYLDFNYGEYATIMDNVTPCVRIPVRSVI